MLYRLYHPEDFPQLYAIEELCFQPPHRFPRAYMRQLVTSAQAAVWIAEEGRRMAGFAIVQWSEEEGQTAAYLQTIEVAPTLRRRGIAGELLWHAECSAATAGAAMLWLHVAEGNSSAIRLYQARGYQLKGREENYYAPGAAALVYAKAITESGIERAGI